MFSIARIWWIPLLVGTLLLGRDTADVACARGVYNSKICSGHGTCNTRNLCECDARHFGFDCSQERCPLGPAWVAPARAMDDAHYLVECSNKGVCDHKEGKCTCDEGFIGSACQRLECPNDCNDVGQCMSLRDLSALFAVGTEPLYDAWDADTIYGCKCSKGYHGYDCSLRQSVEIPFDTTLESLEKIFTTLKSLPVVKVTFGGTATTVCSSTAANPIMIEFIQDFGPQSPIKVLGMLKGVVYLTGGSVFATSAGGILGGRTSVQGTKEWEFCSNRGDCSFETGQCKCFTNPMPGYRSSDGYGNPGTRGDCGCANDKNLYGGPISACVGELACSGHGYCTGSPSYKCICEKGWSTGDCSSRTKSVPTEQISDMTLKFIVPAGKCPSGPSWFTSPSASNTVHNQWSECSDAGICDRTTGQCSCYTPFEGAACEYMKCPGDPVCSGHGQCMTIRQLSLEADVDAPSLVFDYGSDPNNIHTFDRDNILGCKCDPGYEGYDCSKRSCLKGDDPVTTDQVDELQLLKCTATGGIFRLQYRTSTSVDIPFDATSDDLRYILMNSFGFEDPVVEYSSGTKACSTPGSADNIITVNFPIDHGDIPPIRAETTGLIALSGSVSFVTADNGVAIGGMVSQKGTKENAVCSNRGYCDYSQGICSCSIGYGTSDGRGNQGNRDDCGRIMPKIKYVAQELPMQ
ncbi:Tenascin [Phytophthora nicotianae]|uniref:Tenascin n=2 Tax=Phytophthora nicotianae TaxID=4792 RepID=A0A0W8CY73_PHYNI|nr:Tenascin [Phytophthora nicotianae]